MHQLHQGPLEYVVSGSMSSSTMLVFLQGWPDSMEMWDCFEPEVSLGQFRLLRMNIPNHGSEKIPWGQNFEVIRERIKATIDEVGYIKDIVLVAHDWGCLYGYHLDKKYPGLFRHMIVMDVPATLELTSIKAKLLFVGYQLYLIIAFLLGGKLGESMTKKFSKVSGHVPTYFEDIKSDRNFPYYYLWRNALLSPFRKEEDKLNKYRPSVPFTYMFGTNKPAQFHGPKWLAYSKSRQGCEVHSFPAGHWFMRKFKQPVLEIIRRRARL